ncbi:MAG: hypothetical protein U0521_21820 [Anaerolineae bacterium]
MTLDEIESAPLATFGDAVQLVGVRTRRRGRRRLAVWLYWQPLAATDVPYKVFVHLRSPDQIVAQDDRFPQDGRVDTTTWGTETVYRDIYTLPLDGVPAGDYTLVVGFYDRKQIAASRWETATASPFSRFTCRVSDQPISSRRFCHLSTSRV